MSLIERERALKSEEYKRGSPLFIHKRRRGGMAKRP
jgi:hypothetical protein